MKLASWLPARFSSFRQFHKTHRFRRRQVAARPELLETRWLLSGQPDPTLVSLVQTSPDAGNALYNGNSVTYLATFSEDVTGVTPDDFVVVPYTGQVTTGAISVDPVPGNGREYNVTVEGVDGIGFIRLDLKNDGSIQNLAGTPIELPVRYETQTVSVGTDATPQSVATGDLNGDGILDLAVAERFGGGVSLALGNGDGSFQAATHIATGNGPWGVAIADFNGDGQPDLAVDNADDSTISVLLLNGDLSYQTRVTNSNIGAHYALQMAVADFNRDGIQDLALGGHYSDPDVHILLGHDTGGGHGDGTFELPYSVNLPNVAFLYVADLAGHGAIDIVSTDPIQNKINVLINDGQGAFTRTSYATGQGPRSVAVADFDEDGDSDLAVTNSGSNTVSLWLGDGAGAFQSGGSFTAPGSGLGYPTGVATDVNGDGHADLAFAFQAHVVAWLCGNGDGTFESSIDAHFSAISTAETGVRPPTLFVSDLNADGRSDLIDLIGSSTVSVLIADVTTYLGPYSNIRNGAPEVLSVERVLPADSVSNSTSATYRITFNQRVANLDISDFEVVTDGETVDGPFSLSNQQTTGDGASVVTLTIQGIHGSGTLGLNVLANSGIHGLVNGVPEVPQFNFVSPPFTGSAPAAVAAQDLNGDGIPDLVTTTTTNTSVVVALGAGDGSFLSPQYYETGNTPTAVAVVDVNGDHVPDIAVANQGSNTVGILLGDGNGGFTLAADLATGLAPSSLVSLDVNGDQIADLIVANRDDNTLSLFVGNGDGTFHPAVLYATGAAPVKVIAADVNGDSRLDLLVAQSNSTSVSFLAGTANGTFAAASPIPVGVLQSDVAIADVNNDHHPDLILSSPSPGETGLKLMLGNGDGTFASPRNVAANDGLILSWGTVHLDSRQNRVLSVAAADLDGDGNVDLIAGGAEYGVHVLSGNGDGTFSAPEPLPGERIAGIAVADLNGDGAPDLLGGSSRTDISYVAVMLQHDNFTHRKTVGPVTTFDDVPPALSAFERTQPVNDPTTATTLTYTLTFSEDVTGVNAADFRLTPNGVDITNSQFFLSGAGSSYTVTVSGLSGSGMIGIALANHGTIQDRAGNTLATSFLLPAETISEVNPSGDSSRGGVFARADLNQDGIQDVVVNGEDGTLGVLLGTPAELPTATLVDVPGSDELMTVSLEDINGDGKPDLIVAAGYNDGDYEWRTFVAVLPGNGDGTFGLPVRAYTPQSGTQVTGAMSGDVNGDGKPDLIIGTYSYSYSYQNGKPYYDTRSKACVLLGQGDGSFVQGAEVDAGEGYGFFQAADINGDGKTDLLVHQPYDGPTLLFLAQSCGDGTFESPQDLDTSNANQIAVGDLNGDGRADLAIASDTAVTVLLQEPGGEFTPSGQYETDGNKSPFAISSGDINGDGIPDLAFAWYGGSAGGVSVLLGNDNGNGSGDGTFGAPREFALGFVIDLAVLDLNQDGRQDVLAAKPTDGVTAGGVSILLGNTRLGPDGSLVGPTTTIQSDLAAPTITVSAADKTYDGVAYGNAQLTVAVTNSTNQILAQTGDASLSYVYYAGTGATGTPLTAAPKNAGTYTVVAHWSSTDPGQYPDVFSSPVTFRIKQRDLTAFATGNNKGYDGTTAATVTFSTNALAADAGSLTVHASSMTFEDPAMGTNKTITVSGLSLSGSAAGNYHLVTPTLTTTADITRRQVRWIVEQSGDWNEGSNWDIGTPPTAEDDVVIDPFPDDYEGFARVTLTSGAVTVHGLVTTGIVAINGGSLAVRGGTANGWFRTNGGVLILDGSTIEGESQLNGHAIIRNGLTVAGSLNFNVGNLTALMTFDGSQSVSGSGTLSLGSATLEVQSAGEIVTLTSGATLGGTATITAGMTLVNHGTIYSDGLTLAGELRDGTVLGDSPLFVEEDGTVRDVTIQSPLELQGGTLIGARIAATANLWGGNLDGVTISGNVQNAGGDIVVTNNLTFDGGELNLNADGLLISNPLRDANLLFYGNQSVQGSGTIRLWGFGNVDAAEDGTQVTLEQGITLEGWGMVGRHFDRQGNDRRYLSLDNEGTIVANLAELAPNYTGELLYLGPLELYGAGGGWTNDGTIRVTGSDLVLYGEVAGTGHLTLSDAADVDHRGTISIVGAVTTGASSTIGTFGVLTIQSTGSLTQSNAQSSITIHAGATFDVYGRLQGGSVTGQSQLFAHAGSFLTDVNISTHLEAQLSTLIGVTIAGTSNVFVSTMDNVTISGDAHVGGTINVLHDLTFDGGQLTLSGYITNTANLLFDGNQSVKGTGTIRIAGATYTIDAVASGTQVTNEPGITVQGWGIIGQHNDDQGMPHQNLVLNNEGTIQADTFVLALHGEGGGWTNTGMIRAAGGEVDLYGPLGGNGGLAISDAVDANHRGAFKIFGAVTTGASFPVGRFGYAIIDSTGSLTQTNSESTISIAAGSTVDVYGTFQGGSATGPGQVFAHSESAMKNVSVSCKLVSQGSKLTGVTIAGMGDVFASTLDNVTISGSVVAGGEIDVRHNLTMDGGLLDLNGYITGTASLLFDGNQSVKGAGTIQISGDSYTIDAAASGTQVTLEPGITIRGWGIIGEHNDNQGTAHQNLVLANEGTIQAESFALALHSERGFWTNTGVIRAAGGEVDLYGSLNGAGGLAVSDAVDANHRGTFRIFDVVTTGTSFPVGRFGVVIIESTGSLEPISSQLSISLAAGSTFDVYGILQAANASGQGQIFAHSGSEIRDSNVSCNLEAQGSTLTYVTIAGAANVSSSTLDAVTISGNVVSGGEINVLNNLTLDGGELDLNGYVSNTASLLFEGDQSVKGAGTIRMSGASYSIDAAASGTQVTLEQGISIQGWGIIGQHSDDQGTPHQNLVLANEGTIQAETHVLALHSESGGWTNTGVIGAAGGEVDLYGPLSGTGSLAVSDAVDVNHCGTFRIFGAVTMGAAFPVGRFGGVTIENTGSLTQHDVEASISLAADTTFDVYGVLLGGGVTGEGQLFARSGSFLTDLNISSRLEAEQSTLVGVMIAGTASVFSCVLDNVTISGDVQNAGGDIRVRHNLTFDGGQFTLNQQISSHMTLLFDGDQSVQGIGTIQFEGLSFAFDGLSNATKVILEEGITVNCLTGGEFGSHREGQIFVFDHLALTNKGTISANGNVDVQMYAGAGGWTNDGTIQAEAGGFIQINGQMTNAGQISLADALDITSPSTIAITETMTSSGSISVGHYGRLGILGSLNQTNSQEGLNLQSDALVSIFGTLRGGKTSGGLVLSSGTLDGVRLGSNLETWYATLIDTTIGSTANLYGGTLDNVTVTGVIQNAGGEIHVLHNLTLNGGQVTLNNYTPDPVRIDGTATVLFDGNQSVKGTGAITLASCSMDGVANGTQLTLEPGITLRGAGSAGRHVDAAGIERRYLSIVNQGTIEADQSAPLTLYGGGEGWTNSGAIRAAGGSLILYGQFTGTGTLAALSADSSHFSSIQVFGAVTSSSSIPLGIRSGLTIQAGGRMTLTNPQSEISVPAGDLVFAAGTLSGGSVTGAGVLVGFAGSRFENMNLNCAAALTQSTVVDSTIASSAQLGACTLDHVTISSTVTIQAGTTVVRNDLTLASGQIAFDPSPVVPTNSTPTPPSLPVFPVLRFQGDQSIVGNGSIVLTGQHIDFADSNDHLAIGAGITVRGSGRIGVTPSYVVESKRDASGNVVYSLAWAGTTQKATIENFGTIMSTDISSVFPSVIEIFTVLKNTSSGRIVAGTNSSLFVDGQFKTAGLIQAEEAGFVFVDGDYAFDLGATAVSTASGLVYFGGRGTYQYTGHGIALLGGHIEFFNYSTTPLGTSAAPLLLEAASVDQGPVSSGFIASTLLGHGGFAKNEYVKLVDELHTTSTAGAEAFYFDSFIIAPSTVVDDLNGLNVYLAHSSSDPNSGPVMAYPTSTMSFNSSTVSGAGSQLFSLSVDPTGVDPLFSIASNGSALGQKTAADTSVIDLTTTNLAVNLSVLNYVNDPLDPAPLTVNVHGGGKGKLTVGDTTLDFRHSSPAELAAQISRLHAAYTPAGRSVGGGFSGTITIGQLTIVFDGLTPIDVHNVASFTFEAPDAGNQLVLQDATSIATNSGGVAYNAVKLSGSSGGVPFESVNLWDVGLVTIDTTANGDRDDTIAIKSASASNTVAGVNTLALTNLAITTGSGTDTVTIQGPLNIAGSLAISTPLLVFGAAGSPSTIVVQTGTTQDYHAQMLLLRSVALTTAGNKDILLDGTIDAAPTASDVSLVVQTGTGVITVQGDVGAAKRLASITLSGSTHVQANTVATTKAQTYVGPVTVGPLEDGTTVTFSSSVSGAIDFKGQLDGAYDVTAGAAGGVQFEAPVGSHVPLASLTVAGSGVTLFSNAATSIVTTGPQIYGASLSLSSPVALTASQVSVNNSLNSPNGTLTVHADAQLGASSANTIALATLTVDGASTINASRITTSAAQSYVGAATLGANTTFASPSGGSITFRGAIDSALGINAALAVNSGGTISFGGPIGVDVPLASLVTSGNGTTKLGAGTVTTLGTQSYGTSSSLESVQLTADVQLIAGTGGVSRLVTFSSTVTGNYALLVGAGPDDGDLPGNVEFDGNVGSSVTPLKSLTVFGTTTFAGLSTLTITTTGDQTYEKPVLLKRSTTLVTSSGSGEIRFGGTVNADSSGKELKVLPGTGDVTFAAAVGDRVPLAALSIAVGAGSINVGSVKTSGAQTYGEPVSLTGAAVFDAGTSQVRFQGSIEGNGYSLTVGGAAATSASFEGSLAEIGSLVVAGTTTFGLSSPITVRSTGLLDFKKPVLVSQPLVLDTTDDGNSPGANVVFEGTIDASGSVLPRLTISAGTGDVTFLGKAGLAANGALGALNISGHSLNFSKDVRTGGAAVFVLDGALSLSAAFSAGGAVQQTGGGTVLLGGNITTTGGEISFASPVTLTRAVVLDATATQNPGSVYNITLSMAVDGPYDLTAKAGGMIVFAGTVGGNAPLKSLTTGGTSTGLVSVGNVSTSGAQSYDQGTVFLFGTQYTAGSFRVGSGAVTLFANAVTISAGKGTLYLGGTVDSQENGASGLTLDTTGAITLAGNLGATGATNDEPLHALSNLTLANTGITTMTGMVYSTGEQTYNGKVSLSNTGTVHLYSDAQVTFRNPLVRSTTTPNAGLEIHANAVFSMATTTGVDLAALRVDGTTLLNVRAPARIATTGGQTYVGPVTLGSDATLASTNGGTITFQTTVDSLVASAPPTRYGLIVNTTGSTLFQGTVGGSPNGALSSLRTDAKGLLSLADVTTVGDQTYADDSVELHGSVYATSTAAFTVKTGAVTLYAASVLISTGSSGITFGGTIDAATDGGSALTLDSAGQVTLSGTMGASGVHSGTTEHALLSVSLPRPASRLSLTSLSIYTTADQTYTGQVTLKGTVELFAGGTVAFSSAISGATALLNIHADATLAAATSIGALSVSGATELGAVTITTAGTQSYSGPLTLNGNATLAGKGGIAFGGTVDSSLGNANSLTLSSIGSILFTGAVGETSALAALAITGTGTTTIQGGLVITSGAQTYNGPVALADDTQFIAGTSASGMLVKFAGSVTGGYALTVGSSPADANVSSSAELDGNVGTALAPLTSLSVFGGTTFGGSVAATIITLGDQAYGGALLLKKSVTLNTSAGGGQVVVAGAVNGSGADLTIKPGGDVSIAQPIGQQAPLRKLVIEAGSNQGTTSLKSVKTTDAQTYGQTVQLLDDATFDAGTKLVWFQSTIDGNGHSLKVGAGSSAASSAEFDAALSSILNLTVYGKSTFGSAAAGAESVVIESSGTQLFQGAVVLVRPTGLDSTHAGTTAGQNIQFGSTISGGKNLTIDAGAGSVTFAGSVNTGAVSVTGGAITVNGSITAGGSITFMNTGTLTIASGASLKAAGDVQQVGAGTVLLGGTITTTQGGIAFAAPVTLTRSITLDTSATPAADITFGGTLNGAFDLTAKSGGTVTFGGPVGSSTALASLTVPGVTASNGIAGMASIQGGIVKTSGNQTYKVGIDVVVPAEGAGVVITSTAGKVSFSGAISAGGSVLSNHIVDNSLSPNTTLITNDAFFSGTYAETGVWTSGPSNSGVLGSSRKAAVAGNASATATWTMSGLVANQQYAIYVTWQAAANSGVVQYKVQGKTGASTFTVDQSLSPNADADVAGTAFQLLGTFVAQANGTIVVTLRLQSAISGTVISADAVMSGPVAQASSQRSVEVATLDHVFSAWRGDDLSLSV